MTISSASTVTSTGSGMQGQVAVVTGGGGGIGGGISRSLASAGAHVVVNDIDERLAAQTVQAIADAGGVASAVAGDICDRVIVDAVVDAARDAGGGRIDVLVNNVGDFRPAKRTFVASDEEQWQQLYAINLLHVFRCAHAVLPAMIEQRSGSIVNVATVEAFRGIPGHAVYAAFKSGVVGFTRSLAVEVGRHGIRVNALAPDMADTAQTPAEVMLGGRDPDLVGCWIPLGRFGAPADYGDVALFLASPAARFVTGQVIPVDGGTLAASGWYGRASGKGWTVLPDSP